MSARFFFILFFISSTVTAQTYKLDSLKKMLSGLHDRELVDCLNSLGEEYCFRFIHTDSSLKYTSLALQKSSAIQYNIGKAVSLSIQAGVHGRLLRNPGLMEQKSKEAIALLKNENDLKDLSTAYYNLSLAYSLQGKHDIAYNAAFDAKEVAIIGKDKLKEGWAMQAIGFSFAKKGEYWKAFENLIESQRIGKELNDSLLVSFSLAFIARSFNRAGDPTTALSYYHQTLQYAPGFLLIWPHLEDMAYAHMQLKQYDSVLYYQEKHRHNLDSVTTDVTIRENFTPIVWGLSVDVQIALRQYDKVLADILPRLQQQRRNRDINSLMQSLLNLGKVYEGKGNYPIALQYSHELIELSNRSNNKQFLQEGFHLISSLFDHVNKKDSAYLYYKKYIVIRDSMESAQFAQRTALYLAEAESKSRIRILQKDKELKEQQLVLNKKQLQKQANLKNILGISLLMLILISALVIRNIILKRKNDKLLGEQAHLALQRKALELEMQALRTQMNPHFIFNCLSAIDNLIQTNQSDKATTYLARFAKLIRSVLDSSKNNRVTFQHDFETIRLYLEMEQFRCNNKFNYQLTADNELLHGDYKVPPLIVQPFVENAIHHGLLNKEDNNRQLQVQAQLKDEHIIYSITDNGIGRKKAAIIKQVNKPDQRSYGIAITKERIHLHNKSEVNGDVEITDLEKNGIASGTKATIRINSFDL